ncbi:MAG TPA: hypothetical protein VG838_01405 [Opitutaceae bacterium]|nr:hypothetical protein [Opitutaceae bacterium]
MSPKFCCLAAAAALLASTGCQKQAEAPPVVAPPKPPSVEIVKAQEQSRHFLAVNRQLELGGTLYGYADVDGDVLKLAGTLHDTLTQVAAAQPALAPFVNQDYAALFGTLGLTDIKAVGVSSVPDGTGFFRNRAFFYTPDQRHGLLAGLGGKSVPFTHVNLAPADTDIYGESEIDLPAVYHAIQDVVGRVGGEMAKNQLEEGLKKGSEASKISLLNLINGMKGRAAVVMRFDGDKTLPLPVVNLPAFSVLVCVDGVGPAIEPALMANPALARSDDGSLHLYRMKPLPVGGFEPVLAVDGTTLYFATTPGFLTECRTLKSGLKDTPVFRQSLARVGAEGNGLGYFSPHLFQRLRQIETLNPYLPEAVRSNIHLVMARLPAPTQPLVTVRTNLPDGILVRSYWDRSLKQDVALISIYNPVTIGVIAAMAIPAFQKVRAASQEKAVLNNLRQLGAAADQYYLESGESSAKYSDLVGPTKYIKVINSVAGEDYRSIRFQQGRPLQVRLPSTGQTIQYDP